MTSAGRYGWFTDRKGYRYVDRHPVGRALAADPGIGARASGARSSPTTREPDCCLVNHYAATARMGLHRDADEAGLLLAGPLDQPRRPGASSAWAAPARKDPTASVLLE